MNEHEERDEIEQLLARLDSVAPPPDFVAGVMARVREGEVARWSRWQQAVFGAVYLVALALLAVLAFRTGGAMEHSGVRDLLQLAARDIAAVKASPGAYAQALIEAMPWLHLAALAIDALVLLICTRLLLRLAPRQAGPVAA